VGIAELVLETTAIWHDAGRLECRTPICASRGVDNLGRVKPKCRLVLNQTKQHSKLLYTEDDGPIEQAKLSGETRIRWPFFCINI
jgi:hypothetical protein